MIPAWIVLLPIDLIHKTAHQERLDWRLMAAIVYQESKGNAFTARYEPAYKYTYNVYSIANSLGITNFTEEQFQKTSHGYMQIMGGTLRSQLGFTGHPGEIYNKETNLKYGAKLLRILSDKYGEDTSKILAAYNGGTGAVISGSGAASYPNQSYVDSVQKLLRELDF